MKKILVLLFLGLFAFSATAFAASDKTSKKDEEEFQSISENFSFSPLRGIIVKDFNAIDTKLATYFPPNLVQYRWAIVFGLIILGLFLITEIFFSAPVHVPQQPQVIMVQVPAAQPTPFVQPQNTPIIVTVPSQAQSQVPINVTDIKNIPGMQKIGGFSRLFKGFDRSLFSDLEDSEF